MPNNVTSGKITAGKLCHGENYSQGKLLIEIYIICRLDTFESVIYKIIKVSEMHYACIDFQNNDNFTKNHFEFYFGDFPFLSI
jgi:hypothetical protein